MHCRTGRERRLPSTCSAAAASPISRPYSFSQSSAPALYCSAQVVWSPAQNTASGSWVMEYCHTRLQVTEDHVRLKRLHIRGQASECCAAYAS